MADPRGQIGNQLTTDMHMLTVDSIALQNIFYCIKRCDLELAGIASSAYAWWLGLLTLTLTVPLNRNRKSNRRQ